MIEILFGIKWGIILCNWIEEKLHINKNQTGFIPTVASFDFSFFITSHFHYLHKIENII